MPNKTKTYYQPLIRWEKEEWILPEELASFHAFASKSDAEQFVAEKGYSNYELKIEEYHNDDIEEVTILDGYGNIVEINEDDPDDPLVCAVCGSTKVQVQAWVNANTHKFIDLADPDNDDEGNNWCEDCEEHVPLCHKSEFEAKVDNWFKEQAFATNHDFDYYESHWKAKSYKAKCEEYNKSE